MKKLLNILLIIFPLLAWANEEQMDGLHCGDVVTISATPDRGYRFVRWSDGNTDNPRDIEITEAVELTAIYEQTCVRDAVPVVWLYGQLMMVNVDSLQRMGYVFTEKDVAWYRIVGDIDATSGETNDVRLSTGYYYVLSSVDVSDCYVAVDIGDTPQSEVELCSTILYGQVQTYARRNMSYSTSPEQTLTLVPNYGYPGTTMQLMGLNADAHYTIQVYDAVGRLLEDFTSQGEQQIPIIAQRLPGYYLVCVTDGDGKEVLRYVVKQ